MLVVTTHTERTIETVDVPHVCASCGVPWTLRLRAEGVGAAATPFLIATAKAKADAARTAKYDAQATARLALAFTSCASCRHSLLGRRRHWLVRLSPALLLLMAVGLFCPLSQDHREPVDFLYGGVAGAFMCALVLGSRLRDRARAQRAAATIEWFRGEPPDKPYVGCACATCGKTIKSKKKGERCPQCGAPTHHEKCARDHAFTAHGDGQGAYRRSST